MDSFNEIFEMVREKCRTQMSAVAFDLWFENMKPLTFDGMTARISVTSSLMKATIETRYSKLLQDAFREVVGFDVQLDLVVVPPTEKQIVDGVDINEDGESILRRTTGYVPGGGTPSPAAGLDTATGRMTQEYTFDNFIIGSSNKFAHAASWAVASNPAKAYNPLFIYGGSGLGKTHLISAICAEIHKNHPDFRIAYVKSETFTIELIEAIKNKDTNSFREKYREMDVLAMDDVQFIAGRESTQEEFFNTFNTLYHAGKQIVLTSDRPPKEIKTLDDRLRTRFEWGLLADIQPPDFETRVAIIRSKSESMVMDIPDDVADYIATRIKDNIRQLEGIVKKMNAYQKLTDAAPTVLLAQRAIQDLITENQPVPMTIERVIAEVGRTFSVTPEDIRSNKQNGAVSAARQAAMYILREVTTMSMAEIGAEFGRDHSTVVYAVQKVGKKMKDNSHYRETMEDMIKNIKTNRN